jgi:hypothetical protein
MASLKHGRQTKQPLKEDQHSPFIAPSGGIAGHGGIPMDVPITPVTRPVRISDVISVTVRCIRVVMNLWENGWNGKIVGESGHAKDAHSSMHRLLQTTLQRTPKHPSKNLK